MPKQLLPASAAARALGISLDTLRRWDRQGRIRTERDAANRRLVPAEEIERLRGGPEEHALSARNRFSGRIREARVVAVITREAAEQLGLEAGQDATALVKATSVMVER